MTSYTPNLLSVAILDHHRPQELSRLLDSLHELLKVPADIVYCHDGPPYSRGARHGIDDVFTTVITTSRPRGCGIQTRQLFQACMTPYVLYCQVDQYLVRPFTQEMLDGCIRALDENPTTLYIDLAGNQGRGRPSERALLMRRKDYLAIPGIDDVIGGPGPYADHRWTEQHLQEHMQQNGLRFATVTPLCFADNGQESIRNNPDGSRWKHYPDTKQLWLLSGPVKAKFVYPKLSDAEWQSVLDTQQWPAGQIPEQERESSFHVWH